MLVHLPASPRGSLTWDQGREMAQHQQIASATGMGVYFCDAHLPWQCGSNENMNGYCASTSRRVQIFVPTLPPTL